MRKTVFIFFLFIAGCANSDFPFCCDQTGEANIPYLTTYHFDKGSGFANIGSPSFLTIFSKGDETNLFNAANISKIPGTGDVAGTVASLFGGPVAGVTLEATDASGNSVGNFFYNSLGGIPDFAATSGTSVSGGITLLNAPPGEIYFKAIEGGRGNGSTLSFADSVSVVRLDVYPVTQSFIGVTGGIVDFETLTTAPDGAAISPLGLRGLNINSTNGAYRFVSLGSDSDFLMQVSPSAAPASPSCLVPPSFVPSYNLVRSDLASIPLGAIDVTETLFILTKDFLSRVASVTGFPVDCNLGIVAGRSRDPDGTTRVYPYIDLSDDSGNDLNFDSGGKPRIYYEGSYIDTATGKSNATWFFFKDPHVFWSLSAGLQATIYWSLTNGQEASTGCNFSKNTCPPDSTGITDGAFIAFNLPPGQVHLSGMAIEKTPSGGFAYYSGTETPTLFGGGATIQDVTMNPSALGHIGFSLPFPGRVTLPDLSTSVPFAQVFALGTAGSSTVADQNGQFSYSTSPGLFLNQGIYTIRTSASPGYLPTYQSNVSADGSIHSFTLFPSSQVNAYISAAGLSGSIDPSKGILTGMIIDNAIGRGSAGVTLAATDMAGNQVGEIRYFDTQGLPTLNQASSKNGNYMIFNLPPGLVQLRAVSTDDSGNGLFEVYSGGVAVADVHVNNSPPVAVQVSGATQDINGAKVSAAVLSIQGEKTVFSSNNGFFSQAFSPYSAYSVKAAAPGGIDTYNLFGTTGVDSPQTVFVATSANTLSAIAAAAIAAGDSTLSLPDLVNHGVIGGKVATYGFSLSTPVQGFSVAPMAGGSYARHRMATGLFDGDSELDLAIVSEQDSTLTILLGNGDGTFHPASGSPICLPYGTSLSPGQTCPTGANPVAVRDVDLNGDGITDLVVVNRGLDSVTILLGTGKGTFTLANQPLAGQPLAPRPLQLSAGSNPVAVALQDFNNDGLIDLAVVNAGSNSFVLIPGLGGGQFSLAQARYFSTVGTSPGAIISSDFNGDGNFDLAILNQGSGTVSVFLGYGNGYFLPAGGSPYFAGTQPTAMDAGDLNRDGYTDLVIADGGNGVVGSVTILLGKAGGIFAPAAGSLGPFSSSPQYVTVNDLNLDNRLDLITANANGTVSVLTGLGDGTFTAETVYNAGGAGANLSTISLFDFTDDLFTDMAVFQRGTGTLLFFTGAEVPLPGVKLSSTNMMSGVQEGNVRYLDQAGNILIGALGTDVSGRFMVFDVPPGPHDIFATAGASGNRWMAAYKGSATLGNLHAVPPDRKSIQYSGLTVNVVGDQVARNVTGVSISLLGTPFTYFSGASDSTFNFPADANHSFFIRLQR